MPAVIQCPACQKEYPWKPDLAGKRVKCKCGELIDVPVAAPKAEVDELYDLAEPIETPGHPILDLQSAATTAAVAVDNSRQFPCPYCGQNLDPGSTMCVFCGSSLEGTVPEAAPRAVPTAIQAAPPVASRPVVMREPEPEETVSKTKLAILALVAIAIVIAAIVFVRHRTRTSTSTDPILKPADAAIFDKTKQGAEAREWLKADEAHTLTGLLHKQAVFRVDQIYDLGAKSVFVVGGGSSLAIELPSESAKRKAIFDWQKKWNTENNFPVVSDDGQRWMEIQMHL